MSAQETCVALQAGIVLEGEVKTEKGVIRVKRRIDRKMVWDLEYRGEFEGSGDVEEMEDGKYLVSFTIQKGKGFAILVEEAESLADALRRVAEVAES